MSNHPQKTPSMIKNDSYLPNFCDVSVFLRVLLVIELFAIVFALVSFRSGGLYVQIALNSVFIQWIGLSVAAILFGITRLGYLRDTRVTTIVAMGVTLVVTLLVSWLSEHFSEMLRLESQ